MPRTQKQIAKRTPSSNANSSKTMGTCSNRFICLGNKWLFCIDYYSEFFEIELMTETDDSSVIKQTKKWFAAHGIPDLPTIDNGPPFNENEYRKFIETYGFFHDTISPNHSQDNELVEKISIKDVIQVQRIQ